MNREARRAGRRRSFCPVCDRWFRLSEGNLRVEGPDRTVVVCWDCAPAFRAEIEAQAASAGVDVVVRFISFPG